MRDERASCRRATSTDRHLPDKGDRRHRRGGREKISCPSPRQKKSSEDGDRGDHRKIARIRRLGSQTTGRVKNLDRDLKAVVFGRTRDRGAVSAIRRRLGARHPQKPIGCFSSPATGVGQDGGRAPARLLHGIELHRFDMSEYMDGKRVGLIGAPPLRRLRPGRTLTRGHQEALCGRCSMRSRRRSDIFNILCR